MTTERANRPECRFSIDDTLKANEEWGANCGPVTLAAILGITLDEVRSYMGGFEQKRYTNPTLMFQALRDARAEVIEIGQLNTAFEMQRTGIKPWPTYGLARVQWEGPWTAPGVPIRVRYRHTHWVGSWANSGSSEHEIFDVNCMGVGGWVSLDEWTHDVVPWILHHSDPRANGKWHLTHTVEISDIRSRDR